MKEYTFAIFVFNPFVSLPVLKSETCTDNIRVCLYKTIGYLYLVYLNMLTHSTCKPPTREFECAWREILIDGLYRGSDVIALEVAGGRTLMDRVTHRP